MINSIILQNRESDVIEEAEAGHHGRFGIFASAIFHVNVVISYRK